MDINIDDFFDVVVEPEHSKKILVDLQNKYNYDSLKLYEAYKQDAINVGDLNISQDKLNHWIHHFIIYKENGGDLWELKENTEWDTNEERDKNHSSLSFLFSFVTESLLGLHIISFISIPLLG